MSGPFSSATRRRIASRYRRPLPWRWRRRLIAAAISGSECTSLGAAVFLVSLVREGRRAGIRRRGRSDVVMGARGREVGMFWGAAWSGGASRAPSILVRYVRLAHGASKVLINWKLEISGKVLFYSIVGKGKGEPVRVAEFPGTIDRSFVIRHDAAVRRVSRTRSRANDESGINGAKG